MTTNPLRMLKTFGQSVWLDFLSREMMASGRLQRMIDDDGVSGVTTNPVIFEKAIGGSAAYDDAIGRLAKEGKDTAAIYRHLTTHDVRDAADILRPVYDASQGQDGFVSLEVSPHLAHDTEGTLSEARELWAIVDRPNVLIKVPGTLAGLPAFERLIIEGINVNVTLLFSLSRYRAVAEAYFRAVEARLAAGRPVDRVASVASFFLSRIDSIIDPMLGKIVSGEGPQAQAAARLRGEAAIASAKLAYRDYQNLVTSEKARALLARGARAQRLLWASTGTKNPAYNDIKYVEPLIGSDTVNTMPVETIDAFRDHGKPRESLTIGVEHAERMLAGLAEVGIGLDTVTQTLEDEGVQKFIAGFDALIATLDKKRVTARPAH